MAISVDYGPISTAMGLAVGAGQAQRQQIGFGEDVQAIGAMQRAQQLAQSQRATEIQQSLSQQGLGLEAQRNNAQQQLAQAQLADSSAYRQANLQSLNGYRQGNVQNNAQRNQNTADFNQARGDALQQNADTRSQQANSTDAYHQMIGAVQQQNANTRQQGVQQQGQVSQQSADDKQLQNFYNGLDAAAKDKEQNAAKNFQDVTKDPEYQNIKQQMQAVQQSLAQRTSSTANKPAVAPQAISRIAQQGGINPQLQNQTPQTAPQAQYGAPDAQGMESVVPGSKGPISPDIAAKYLERVGGKPGSVDQSHIQAAKEAARADGWQIN